MMEAQKIVVANGSQAVPLVSRGLEVASLRDLRCPGLHGAEAAVSLFGAAETGAREEEGAEGSEGAATFLDTLLSTCRSWRTSDDGSYEDVDPCLSEAEK